MSDSPHSYTHLVVLRLIDAEMCDIADGLGLRRQEHRDIGDCLVNLPAGSSLKTRSSRAWLFDVPKSCIVSESVFLEAVKRRGKGARRGEEHETKLFASIHSSFFFLCACDPRQMLKL